MKKRLFSSYYLFKNDRKCPNVDETGMEIIPPLLAFYDGRRLNFETI